MKRPFSLLLLAVGLGGSALLFLVVALAGGRPTLESARPGDATSEGAEKAAPVAGPAEVAGSGDNAAELEIGAEISPEPSASSSLVQADSRRPDDGSKGQAPDDVPEAVGIGTVVIQVIDSTSGSRLPNIAVWYARGQSTGSQFESMPLRTNADGMCRFDDVKAGWIALYSNPLAGTKLVLVEPGMEAQAELHVLPSAVLCGRVYDQNGAPVAGSRIFELNKAAGPFQLREPLATTDSNGAYEARISAGGRITELCAVGPAHVPSEIQRVSTPDSMSTPRADFVLGGPGGLIRFAAKAVDGSPIVGAAIELRVAMPATKSTPPEYSAPWYRNGTVLWRGSTDSQGRFEIAGLPFRHLIVTVHHLDYAPAVGWIDFLDPKNSGSVPSRRIESVHDWRVLSNGDEYLAALIEGVSVAGQAVRGDGQAAEFPIIQVNYGLAGIGQCVVGDRRGRFLIRHLSPHGGHLTVESAEQQATISISDLASHGFGKWNPVLR